MDLWGSKFLTNKVGSMSQQLCEIRCRLKLSDRLTSPCPFLSYPFLAKYVSSNGTVCCSEYLACVVTWRKWRTRWSHLYENNGLLNLEFELVKKSPRKHSIKHTASVISFGANRDLLPASRTEKSGIDSGFSFSHVYCLIKNRILSCYRLTQSEI